MSTEKLKGACLIGQSGGPTAVINASAYGVIEAALSAPEITHVYGAAHGIKGVLAGELYDLNQEDPEELKYLMHTPSSELGSCRFRLKDPAKDDCDYKQILNVFKKYNIRYFFYNGGNDSMDTCDKVSHFMANSGWDCRVIGVPKTIDNDLYGTDHCPGFPSAAKYIASSCAEVYKDANVYDTGLVTIIEIMGRHAGWLAASSSLAGCIGCGPDLIYLPEIDFDMDNFLDHVENVYSKKNNCIVAVSEGLHYDDGTYVSAARTSATDGFGHAQLGGTASRLTATVSERMNVKVRGIELSLLQRCGTHLASQTDISEAYLAGKAAMEYALAGETGKMVGFERDMSDGTYHCRLKLLTLDDVANYEKKVPMAWITPDQNHVTQEYIDYALPLIQGEPEVPKENGLPRFARLKKILAK